MFGIGYIIIIMITFVTIVIVITNLTILQAALQIIFSLGSCSGCNLSLASYNRSSYVATLAYNRSSYIIIVTVSLAPNLTGCHHCYCSL